MENLLCRFFLSDLEIREIEDILELLTLIGNL
jgi:hypothetical protein